MVSEGKFHPLEVDRTRLEAPYLRREIAVNRATFASVGHNARSLTQTAIEMAGIQAAHTF
jgi:hypothetical protein